jgi:tRNA isopentenyl-2-thiomethyl-A-37 hydroxylase MiaE
MNERIEELALQCGAWHQVYDQKLLKVNEYFNYEKFAELIVKECAGIVDNKIEVSRYVHEAELLRECSTTIKLHFGVGE